MKAIVTAALVTLTASAALAKPSRPAPAAKKPAVEAKRGVEAVSKLNLGLAYGLKERATALPDTTADNEEFEVARLKENQVSAIVKERADDLEYCWLRLPSSKRVVSAAILHLSIEASGKVAAVEVNGDLPAGVGKCITQMAQRWTFPAADASTEIDHGIMLTTTSQK